MSDLDVSLRVKLINDVSKEAKRLEGDLKKLDRTVDGIGKRRNTSLGKGIDDLGRKARDGVAAVKGLEKEVRKLDAVKTNKAETEINALGTASNTAKGKIRALDTELGKLGRSKTDQAEAEIKALGTASTTAIGKVKALDREIATLGNGEKLGQINAPAEKLGGVMGVLQNNAGKAWGALLAFASVDAVLRGLNQLSEGYRRLDRDVASVAVTAEMRSPEAMDRINKSNEKLSLRYGIEQPAVNAARKSYAAAGIGLDQQETILDPTLRAAKAGDSTGETISQAVIALQQNLKVGDSDVKPALDMMAKGAKLGSFEVDAMAKNFPMLATMYANTGRKGLDATAELIALAQIVRKGAGTQDEAATNLQNILAKIASPDAVKNFKEKGVDLEAVSKRAEQSGEPYMMAVVDEVMRLTKGDQFKIGELFGDMQAKQALSPLINNRELYNTFLNAIRNQSEGTVDLDYDFLKNLPQEKNDRRGAALEATGNKVGQKWDAFMGPVYDWFARTANSDYETIRRKEELPGILGDMSARKGEIEARLGKLKARRKAEPENRSMLDPEIANLEAQIEELVAQIEELDSENRRLTPADRPIQSPDTDLGKSTGKIPIPQMRPLDQQLGKDLSGAADAAMDGYNDRLKAQLDEAIAKVGDAVTTMKSMLNFSAAPVISPTFVPTKTSTDTAPVGKQTSVTSSSPVKVAQNFYQQNSKLAAMRAINEQNRAVRLAQAGAYADLGPKLA